MSRVGRVRHDRAAVIDAAVRLLDRYGLADLTMRRLGRELGVQPSALYHHVPNKQMLLAAVADEILTRHYEQPGRTEAKTASTDPPALWAATVTDTCRRLRQALLAVSDGAEVVATAYSFGLGAALPARDLHATLAEAGFGADVVQAGADALLHYVYGSCVDHQTPARAVQFGATLDGERRRGDFDQGLAVVVAGLEHLHAT